MKMKFRAHDTFFIRKGWLTKGMEQIVAKPDLFVDWFQYDKGSQILAAGSWTYTGTTTGKKDSDTY